MTNTETNQVTYFGSRATVTVEHHDSSPFGDRTVTTSWIDDADPRNGGHVAGTVTRKRIKGDGRNAPVDVIEPETVIG